MRSGLSSIDSTASTVIADKCVPLLLEEEHSSSSSPFLPNESLAETEILPLTHREIQNADERNPNSTDLNQRLASLDVFRGFTVALMILVDDAGGSFPSINHSPWIGLTLADFVMPFFLFSVGISTGLVFKNVSNKPSATQKVLMRTIKLFVLGLVLQGGYFHGLNHLTYGVDVNHIRWMGVLQRISIGYFAAAISEIWLISNIAVDSAVTFVKKYYIQWMVPLVLSSAYIGLLYGLYVPNWGFEVTSTNSTLLTSSYGSETQIVQCGVRGNLGPPCNAVGLIDRLLLGERHLYQLPVYRRTKECSVNSPDYGPLPPTSPGWCLAPFDPEGILSSFMAAVTCFVGLHYGHLIVHFKSHKTRILLWIISSLPLLALGYIMVALGIPLSKPLYTLSYMCITAGFAGFLLTSIYFIVDVKHFRKPTLLLQWMGMNALIVYALAACDLLPAAIQGVYWHSPTNNLVNATESLCKTLVHSEKWGKLVFVLLEILFWCLVSGFLHMKRIYVKL